MSFSLKSFNLCRFFIIFFYSLQIVGVLDPDNRGEIDFVQFCEGVKHYLELQGISPAVLPRKHY